MKQNLKITTTLILASVLVVLLSFVMPKDKEKYLGARFWTQKTFAPAVYDIVLLGDSRMYRGLSPQMMKEKIPVLKILNFAYSNGSLNSLMLESGEKKLAKNSVSKVIVLGVSPNCITGYSQKNEQFLQEKNRPREEIFERQYLSGILYRFSATTPEAVRKKIRQKPSGNFYKNEYCDNGYVESEKFPPDTTEAISSYVSDYTNYKVEEQYVAMLIAQVKSWTDSGIVVFGFRPPVSAPMRALEDTLGLYNETEISSRFKQAGGYWFYTATKRYKTYDGSHLDIESANILSAQISDSIKTILNHKN